MATEQFRSFLDTGIIPNPNGIANGGCKETTVSGDTISEDTISEDTVSVTEADPDPDDADYERKDLDVPAFLRRQAD